MAFRLGSIPRIRLLLVAVPVATLLVLVAAQRPSADRRMAPVDSLARAKYLVWMNNWPAAARVLDQLKQSGQLEAADRMRLLSAAVGIRGNVESLSLPSAAGELAILATEAVRVDPELRIQILAMKGDVEFQYDLPAAESTWSEIRRLATATGQDSWRARAEGELGCIAFLNGEVYTALKRVVAAFLKAELSNDIAAKMKTLTALGEGLAEFGRPADAIRFFSKVLELSAENPDAYFPFTAYLGKARLLLATAAPGEGRQMLSKGLSEARREGMRVREARILTVIGEDAIRTGDWAGAVGWLSSAVDVARLSGLHRIEADAGSKLASVLNRSGEFDSAAIYARASVVAAERSGDAYHLPQYLAALGEIEGNRGDLSAARAAYERATRLVNALFQDLPNARHESTLVAKMAGIFHGYFELALTKLHDPALAFEVLESARARGLVDRIRASQFMEQGEGQRDPVMLRQVADLNRRLAQAQASSDRGRLLDQLWETELRSLQFAHAPDQPQFQGRPVGLRELQSILNEGEVLIEYSLGSPRSLAFAVTRDQAVPYALRGRKEIESAVAAHLEAIQKKRDARPEGKLVFDLLLGPIALVDHSRRLVIVPDGSSHLAPLPAAVAPQGGYLAETHVTSFAPSATAFYLLSQARRLDRKRVGVLGVGGARYPAALAVPGQSELRTGGLFSLIPPRFSKLVRSGIEVADLAAAGDWEARSITGEDATESVLKREPLSSFDVVHFSVHSAIDREFPDRSGLVLTSASGAQDDDLLQAREIMGLKIRAELVTLSACHGAAGTAEGIAGTNSLVEAFLMAGARSVLASVWEADDAFTAALMRRFYANLQLGHDKASALAFAQRELLRIWGPTAVPVYWAGFRIVGDAHGTISGGEVGN